MIFRPVLLLLILIASHADAKEAFAGHVSYVSDGDTLWVQPDTGGAPRKLRIDGIDAPELCQAGGAAARRVLAQRALYRSVSVTVMRHDSYGRGLARILIDGHDLGAELVRAGQAWSYRWRQQPGPYAAEEALARQAGHGLFALDQPELPRDFRQRHGACYSPGR